jgi:hypothetical protein
MRKIFSVMIPNYLFGKPIKGGERAVEFQQGIKELFFDQTPTKPDLIYSSKMEDFLANDIGWYRTAAKVVGRKNFGKSK